MPAETHPAPRVIAWELTRRCPLSCRHCRAAAGDRHAGEFTTEECDRLLANLAGAASPVLILTGGEPMLRSDVYRIAGRADGLGLRVVMAPCGMLLDRESVRKLLDAGVRMISVSLDGADAESHDAFRGREGAFEAALQGIEAADEEGLPFQINTTVTEHNADDLPRLLDLAEGLGAAAFNPFMLVPTGRGSELADQELSPERYEGVLRWLAVERERRDITIRVTCGPHFQRILRQQGGSTGGRPEGGCLGGKSFAFISFRGRVQICGFLEVECGDLRESDYDFQHIWDHSPVLRRIRDADSYGGRCGACEYRRVCGGCRARAYAASGDYMAEEPRCSYRPQRRSPGTRTTGELELDDLDRRALSVLQSEFPVQRRPFGIVADRLGCEESELLSRLRALHDAGIIRRLGAVFDARRLGYVTTLVAARVSEDRLEEVADLVSALRGVSHNYSRTHRYNLWFTLRARSDKEIERTLEEVRNRTGIEDIHSLPALKTYSRDVIFELDGQRGQAGSRRSSHGDNGRSVTPVWLTRRQKMLGRALQGHMVITADLYAVAADDAGWQVDDALEEIQEWKESGLIRRVGVLLDHHRAGFRANGMAVFRTPEDEVDRAGRALASRRQVTHCYRRATPPGWDYQLFAMVHGGTTEQVEDCVERMAQEVGLKDYCVLFSTREFKKVSPRYFE